MVLEPGAPCGRGERGGSDYSKKSSWAIGVKSDLATREKVAMDLLPNQAHSGSA